MTSTHSLVDLISTASEVIGARVSDRAVAVMVKRLAKYQPAAVGAALERCINECRRSLTLADILERMPNQLPTGDQAWEIAVSARIYDEDITVVVPNAVLRSFPYAIWEHGDKIGARRAFLDAYAREIQKPDGGDIWVSDGHDPALRAAAIAEAVKKGILPPSAAAGILPSPDTEPTPTREKISRQ